jgi:hypothetical protein
MTGRAPRTPVDPLAVTRDTKARIRRINGELEAIEQQKDPIFSLATRRVPRTDVGESRT